MSIIKFRSTPVKELSDEAVQYMLKEKGFFDFDMNNSVPGFSNSYETQHNGKVVYDRASDLMWQQSGSDERMLRIDDAKVYIDQLNRDQFAGYSNWRLPTLEEAMSLMESKPNRYHLFIDPIFDRAKEAMWTSDLFSSQSEVWIVNFNLANCIPDHPDTPCAYNVRAVRNVSIEIRHFF